MYWKSQLWLFHVRFIVVQCTLIPMGHDIIFFTITSLDQKGITNIVATSSIHVVVERRKDGSYMDLIGPFGYSQTVRWCNNMGFGNACDDSYICIIKRYVSTRSTMNIYGAIFY